MTKAAKIFWSRVLVLIAIFGIIALSRNDRARKPRHPSYSDLIQNYDSQTITLVPSEDSQPRCFRIKESKMFMVPCGPKVIVRDTQ
jgi:hypothetical protein